MVQPWDSVEIDYPLEDEKLSIPEYFAELIRAILRVVGLSEGKVEVIPDEFWFRNDVSTRYPLLVKRRSTE